ncbi:MAG TPA: protein kinase [Pyrinomonadaceae bacterium]|nr:protein kinase [Pyrinomonadaceae bacterium]
MTIPVGTKLGRYEIRSKLGAGGMGEVYLAQDSKLDRKVALKILPAEVAVHQDRMRRFVQEAKAASALNHPNIITIYEIEQIDSVNFIATEFIDGETLRQRMRFAPTKLSEVLKVAIQSASALTAAHAANIIHRDIKPENVMLRRDGIVKVLDFGLAKLTEQSVTTSIDTEASTRALINTEPGMVMGTAIYMSPEQARGLDLDARTDIFSLGVVLYEMVAGCLPFEGSTSSEVLAAILSEKEPQPLARYSREVPAELERIVSKALRKNRDERYQTIKDMLLDLESLKQELEFARKLERSASPKSKSEVETREPEGAETVMGSAARSTLSERGPTSAIKLNQRSVVIAVAALLIIAAGVGSYFYFMRARSVAINSIAVLPFINASGNGDIEYLSDGLTESLITSLSQLPKLSVKARSSVFRYKGKDAPPQQVGKELNVQAILNGRLVQRGNDLTLHIELVDVETETALWSADYNRSLTNLVSLPSEIARDVSSKLRLKLSGTDEQRVAKNYTANTEAYQLYLKGRYHLLKSRPETQTAISYFQQAIEIDPSYALAYVGLADVYRRIPLSGAMPPTEFFPKAKAAAQKAIEIDDNLAEAHAELGFAIFWYDWNWNAAENQLKRALELNPNSADTRLFYATFLSNTGRHGEALAESKRARELDPLNLGINALEGYVLIQAGRTDEAIARLQKTLELEPNYGFAHMFASSAYIEKGMFAEAVAEARKAREFSGVNSEPIAFLGYALAKSGKQGEARGLLQELLKQSAARYVSPCHIALVYNGLGERDEALTWLERGFEQRDPRMVFLKVEPKWNNLRADPRFQDLLRRVGFPQ